MASLVRFRYSLPGCLPPCTDQTGILPQPPGTFTSRLSTDRSSSPLLDITTTATGLLCWRDSHPLEWQLASLHGHSRPGGTITRSSHFRCSPIATEMVSPRTRREGPLGDIAFGYSITSSATLRSLSGIVRPSALAVLRLIESSNVVGCSIGKSLGFAPLKILSTYEAERRMSQSMVAP